MFTNLFQFLYVFIKLQIVKDDSHKQTHYNLQTGQDDVTMVTGVSVATGARANTLIITYHKTSI